jgi:riboflavin-specific deaminase-like protein
MTAVAVFSETLDFLLETMPENQNRPRITINMAMSADGKTSSYRRETFSLGSPEDRHLMDVLRAKSDAVIVGARTLSLDGWAIRVRDTKIRRKRIAQKRGPHPLNVVVTTDLNLPARAEFFTYPHTKKLIITTTVAPSNRIRRFQRLAEVIVLPRKRIRALDTVRVLSERGIKNVLVEGGGTLNYSFFRDKLVDEMYVTLTPRVLGGVSAPTVVDGKGFTRSSQIRLTLVSSRRRGDEVFLRYRIVRP